MQTFGTPFPQREYEPLSPDFHPVIKQHGRPLRDNHYWILFSPLKVVVYFSSTSSASTGRGIQTEQDSERGPEDGMKLQAYMRLLLRVEYFFRVDGVE